MKPYVVVKRNLQWHMMIAGQEPGLIRHDDRDFVVRLASDVAALNDGLISVYGEDGQLSYALRFKGGVAVRDPN